MKCWFKGMIQYKYHYGQSDLGQSIDCPFFYKLENIMPIYQYKNEETGEVTDHFMSIADMEQFDIDNPHMKKIIHAAAFGCSARLGIRKTDDSFNSLMKHIKKNNEGSTIKTR